MLAHGTTTFEAKSGYGLDRDTELAQLRAIGRARGVPTFLGAHAVPPEFADGDAYLDFLLGEVSRTRPGWPRPPTSSSSRERSAPTRPGGTSRRAGEAGLALRLHADQFTEAGAVQLAVELGARSVDHLEATSTDGVQLWPVGRRGGAPPVAALTLDRPMPPARALADAGAIVVLATDFNPGSAFCESLPLVMNLACTQLGLAPAEALAACTVNAAHVLGRADRVGRLEPGRRRHRAARRRRLALPRLPSGGEHVALVVKEGEVVWER